MNSLTLEKGRSLGKTKHGETFEATGDADWGQATRAAERSSGKGDHGLCSVFLCFFVFCFCFSTKALWTQMIFIIKRVVTYSFESYHIFT